MPEDEHAAATLNLRPDTRTKILRLTGPASRDGYNEYRGGKVYTRALTDHEKLTLSRLPAEGHTFTDGSRLILGLGETTFGRGNDKSDIDIGDIRSFGSDAGFTEDHSISRLHLGVQVSPGGELSVRDLGSKNGTSICRFKSETEGYAPPVAAARGENSLHPGDALIPANNATKEDPKSIGVLIFVGWQSDGSAEFIRHDMAADSQISAQVYLNTTRGIQTATRRGVFRIFKGKH